MEPWRNSKCQKLGNCAYIGDLKSWYQEVVEQDILMLEFFIVGTCDVFVLPTRFHVQRHREKVLAKQKQRDKSTTTIAIEKRTAAIDSRRRIDPGASVAAPARPQEEGAHRNPHNGVGSRKGLAENATDATRRPTSKRRIKTKRPASQE